MRNSFCNAYGKTEKAPVKRIAALFAALLMVSVLAVQPVPVSGKAMTSSVTSASIVSFEEYSDGWYGNLYLQRDDDMELVAENCFQDYLTKGRYLFYAKRGKYLGETDWGSGNYKHSIYRIDLITKMKKKIISGERCIPVACNGKWLYAGRDNAMDGVELYAINIETGRKRFMDMFAGYVQCAKGRVLVVPRSGDLDNNGITIFKTNGKKVKLIKNAFTGKIKGKKIYYASIRRGASNSYFRVYRCDLNGKHRKAVTKWSQKYPSKYVD